MKVDVEVSTKVSRTVRARQLLSMFDVPDHPRSELSWHGDIDLDGEWSVGLIVGPSGAGKTTVANQLWGVDPPQAWAGACVIDDFPAALSMQDVAGICQAVGFNTVPAWLRPFDVLSTGEKFRVELARRLIEATPDRPLVVDEFTSVVDRQVAKIGAHAVQKWVRRNQRRFVAVSCHYDIIDWLQPDWILEPATMTFRREHLQPGSRPSLQVTIAPVPYATWGLFAPFHYLTASLNRSARCFCLFVGDEPAAFAGVLPRPHPTVKDVRGLSRVVTLPDWQGLGLAFVLMDRLGAAYKAAGYRFHTYPAHPALIHGFDRSPMWGLRTKPLAHMNSNMTRRLQGTSHQLGRPCAVFQYVGPADAWSEVMPGSYRKPRPPKRKS